jgi:hypothetical protein
MAWRALGLGSVALEKRLRHNIRPRNPTWMLAARPRSWHSAPARQAARRSASTSLKKPTIWFQLGTGWSINSSNNLARRLRPACTPTRRSRSPSGAVTGGTSSSSCPPTMKALHSCFDRRGHCLGWRRRPGSRDRGDHDGRRYGPRPDKLTSSGVVNLVVDDFKPLEHRDPATGKTPEYTYRRACRDAAGWWQQSRLYVANRLCD